MSILNHLASIARNLFARGGVERELDAELRAYLDQLADQKIRAGMDAELARRAARIELGGLEQVKEEVREVRAGEMLRQFLQDLRYGFRTLRKSPAYTAAAVLAVALGIGANTAMFSVAYGILLRPLPYPEADRIAVVFMRYFPRDFAFGTMCVKDFLIWRDNNHAFEYPSLFRNRLMDVSGSGRYPEQMQGAQVTAGFFSAAGVHAIVGRTFGAGDDSRGAAGVAVLSESMWRRRFGASPDIVGQSILVNGATTTVLGVMPGDFHIPRPDTDIWTNLPLATPARYGPWFYRGIARLKPGVTIAQAQADVNQIALRMMQEHPDYKRLALPVLSLRDALLGPSLRPAMLVLAGAVGLVLLIAVVNVANLMLARATAREREMALRLSLGARRGRLIRQLLAESLVLATSGGLAGLLLAWGGIELVRAWNPGSLPLIEAVRLDLPVLGFMLAVTLVTGILFGLAPALQSARADLNSTIKEGGRAGTGGANRGRTRSALVISEIAISMMLLVGAGLLLRSFAHLQQVSAGFSTPPSHILHMVISTDRRTARNPAAGLAVYEEVLRRIRALPGVELATLTDSLPPDRQGDADTFGIEGQNLADGELNPIISVGTVGPDFFETLGIPLVKGRTFNTHDTADSMPVAMVSEGFARRFYPDQDPIGRRIRASGPTAGNPWMEIVGVVGNVKYLGLASDTDAAYYLPLAQNYSSITFLAVRASGNAAALAGPVRRAIQSIDPTATLAWTGSLDETMRQSVSQPRFDALLLAVFAAVALLLAAVGVYGLIAYSVVQRTHEIGVRVALGAARGNIVMMVLRQGAFLTIIGSGLGLAGAFALTGVLKTMLFGIRATDALTFVAAPLVLMAIALTASLLPALRATRVSPMIALREN